MDRPALPVLPSPADAPRAALYRDDHHRRGAARRPRAAAGVRSGRASGRAAARRLAIRGKLAQCARIAADFGYDEINLNVGCPSDRVQEGRFGACLMAEPALVGDCVAAMKAAVEAAGHRQMPHRHRRAGSGGGARSAHLRGRAGRRRRAHRACAQGLARRPLAAREPRHPAARLRPRLSAQGRASAVSPIVLNGGIADLDQAARASRARRWRHDGARRLSGAVAAAGGRSAAVRRAGAASPSPKAAAEALIPYIERELARGTRLHAITRHVLGLFRGVPGRARLPPPSGDRGGEAGRGRRDVPRRARLLWTGAHSARRADLVARTAAALIRGTSA